jgi:hypothetical protein
MSFLEPPVKRPICAVCNKPVDDIRSMHNLLELVIYYKVSCHGDTETIKLDELTMFDKAFTKPELK